MIPVQKLAKKYRKREETLFIDEPLVFREKPLLFMFVNVRCAGIRAAAVVSATICGTIDVNERNIIKI